jgi:hypothetical protein
MTDQIALDRFSKDLLDALDEAFEHHHGIFLDKGTSLFETLDQISAADASKRAGSKCATIAAHAAHVRFYLDVLDDIMRTEQLTKIDWRKIWETVEAVTPEEWEAEKQKLRESYQRVVNTIKSYDRWEGEFGVGGSLSVLAHTAYHLGAIRQSWCAIRSNEA